MIIGEDDFFFCYLTKINFTQDRLGNKRFWMYFIYCGVRISDHRVTTGLYHRVFI